MFSVCLVWHKEKQGRDFAFSCLPGKGSARPQVWAVLCGLDKFTSAITSCMPCWMAFYVLARSSVGLSPAQHCFCSSDGYYAFESRMGTPG